MKLVQLNSIEPVMVTNRAGPAESLTLDAPHLVSVLLTQ